MHFHLYELYCTPPTFLTLDIGTITIYFLEICSYFLHFFLEFFDELGIKINPRGVL